MTPQRVGIFLAGERPTPEEKKQLMRELEERAGIFDLRVRHAYDPVRRKWVNRLDAIEREPEIAFP